MSSLALFAPTCLFAASTMLRPSPFIETFPALAAIPGLVHGFLLRSPDIDVNADRETALARLDLFHTECLARLGIARSALATGEQVHGREIGATDGSSPSSIRFPGTDGLLTATSGQFLGVYVADCGPVYLVDPVRRACGVVHSGKKGTELGIVPRAIGMMGELYGSEPTNLVVQLGPCIRPPAYEIDFAATLLADCVAAGVPASQVHDCGVCTSSDRDRFYSYRIEKGRTGRHFALIGWSRSADSDPA